MFAVVHDFFNIKPLSPQEQNIAIKLGLQWVIVVWLISIIFFSTTINQIELYANKINILFQAVGITLHSNIIAKDKISDVQLIKKWFKSGIAIISDEKIITIEAFNFTGMNKTAFLWLDNEIRKWLVK